MNQNHLAEPSGLNPLEPVLNGSEAFGTVRLPGVNNLGTFGRWAFAEFTDVYQMEADFSAMVAQELERVMTESAPILVGK